MKKLLFSMVGVMFLMAATANCFAQNAKYVETVVYDVSVHCNSCKTKIERDVAFEKGVKEITASVEDKTVTVKFDTRKTDTDKIAAAIKKLGYEVAIHGDKAAAQKPNHTHNSTCADREHENCEHNHHDQNQGHNNDLQTVNHEIQQELQH